MEMRFVPPVPRSFERGNKSEIRAFFYKGTFLKGTAIMLPP